MGVRSLRAISLALGLLLAAVSCGGPEAGDGQGRTPAPPVSYEEHGAAGGVMPPGDSMSNPLGRDSSAVAEGERLFVAMNCDGCHGGGATGFIAPSLVDGRWRYGGGDGALYHSIFYGRPRGMPAYGGILSENTIWQLVSYLRSRPVPAAVPTEAWP